jgi:hypothetical protein
MAHRPKKKHKKGTKPKLFQTKDVWGNPVHCTQENWVTHIVVEHPELIGREAHVQQAIEDPDRVSPSTITGLAFGLEKDIVNETVRAITYYVNPADRESGQTEGRLGTAYVVDTVNYNSRVGPVIYQKPIPAPVDDHQIEEEKKGGDGE